MRRVSLGQPSRAGARAGGLTVPPPSAYWGRAHRLAILLIAIIAVRLHELLPFVRPLKPAFTVALIGLFFLLRSTKPRAINTLFQSRIFLLVLAYFAWACVTVPFALWIGLAATTVFVFVPALFLLMSIMLCPPTLPTLRTVQAGFVGTAALSAAALFTVGTTRYDNRLDLGGSYDSNDTAALMALCFPFALGLVLQGRGRQRLLGILAGALLSAAVVGTGSRGGTLALAAGVLVYVIGLRGSRKVSMLAAVGVGAILLWTFAPPDFRERITALARGEQDYNTTDYTGRKQIWARASLYIKGSPIVGVGVGNFPVAEGNFLEAQGKRGKWSAAHNAYLQATAELGIPGGILFVALLVTAMVRAFPYWRMRGRGEAALLRHRPELLASVSAFAVSSFFLSHAYFFVFFALIGLVELATQALRASAIEAVPAGVMAPGSGRRQRTFVSRPGPGFHPGAAPGARPLAP